MLPNLAFVGGAGELAYWVQLTDLFQSLHLPFLSWSDAIPDCWSMNGRNKTENWAFPCQAFFQPQEALLQQFVHGKWPILPGDLDAQKGLFGN